MSKTRISSAQFAALIIMFVVSSSTLILPSLLAAQARQDAWIAAVIGVAASLLLVLLYVKLGSRYPALTLVEYSQIILGKPAGIAVMLFFNFYLFIITTGLLTQVGLLSTSLILGRSPAFVINLLFFIVILFAVHLGLEVFARAAQLFLPVISVLILLLFSFLMPLIHFDNITPLLEFGFPPVLKGVITVIGIPFLDLVILLMIFPFVENTKSAGNVFVLATAAGGLLLIMVIALSILVLGPYSTGNLEYPFFSLAQKVNIGNFVQRIESVVIAIWMVSLFFKITLCYYAMLLTTGQLLRLKSPSVLIVPLGTITLAMTTAMFPATTNFWSFISDQWTISVAPYGLFIPAALLLFDIGKKRIAANKHK